MLTKTTSKVSFTLPKTISLGLEPVPETKEKLDVYRKIEENEELFRQVSEVRTLIDGYHNRFIADCLYAFKTQIDWSELFYLIYKEKTTKLSKEEKKKLTDSIKEVTKVYSLQMSAIIAGTEGFDYVDTVTPSRLMTEVLQKENPGCEALSISATYLQSFQTVRKTLYGNKKGSIIYRILFENFPRYVSNAVAFQTLKEKTPQLLEEFLNKVRRYEAFQNINVDELFTAKGYSNCYTATGIGQYNAVINGYTDKKKNNLYNRGISNLYREAVLNEAKKDKEAEKSAHKVKDEEATKTLEELKNKIDIPTVKFCTLHKQMLTPISTESFIPAIFKSDSEMFFHITKYCNGINNDIILSSINEALENLCMRNIDLSKVNIFTSRLNNISNATYGNWKAIENGIENYAYAHFGEIIRDKFKNNKRKTEKGINRDIETEVKKFLKRDYFSLSEVEDMMRSCGEEGDITALWKNIDIQKDTQNILNAVNHIQYELKKDNDKNLAERKDLLPELEESFKKMSETVASIKMLLGGKVSDKETINNEDFNDITEAVDELARFHRLHLSTRAWCTKKPYIEDKMEMFFGLPQFGEGFAAGENYQNIKNKGVMFFRKKCHDKNRTFNAYYLGILNKASKPNLAQLEKGDLQTSDTHMLSTYSVRPISIISYILSESVRPQMESEAGLNDEIRKIVADRTYSTNKDDLTKLIAFAIRATKVYPTWKSIKFNFKEPESYDKWMTFCEEFSEQADSTQLMPCNESVLNEFVKNGQVFLFKVTSHGIKHYEAGKPIKDKMTEFFIRGIEQNSKEGETTVKIKGGCDVFFRRASIQKPFTHKKGSVLLGRIDLLGNKIPNDIYKELTHYYNASGSEALSKRCAGYDKLSADAKRYIKEEPLNTRIAEYDIIKDRIYTKDTYQLHLSVVANANAQFDSNNVGDMNKAEEALNAQAVDMYNQYGNILAITRGEKHLIHYCLYNKDRGFIEEGNFDNVVTCFNDCNNQQIVKTTNFLQMYDEINGRRKKQAKTWQEREKISGVQDAYIKRIVREIINLALFNHAVIAVEDMSCDLFAKCIHSKMEAPTYRKFISILLDGLACFASDIHNYGIIEQYTVGSKNVKDNTGQNGIVFFVEPTRLQNTDPVTGFCNLFGKYGKMNTTEKVKGFFEHFSSITNTDDGIRFHFKYSDFKIYDIREMKDEWDIELKGNRINFKKVDNKPTLEIVDICEQFRNIIVGLGWSTDKGNDLKPYFISKDMTYEQGEALKSAFFLGMRCRLIAKLANGEYEQFISVAPDKNGNCFEGHTAGLPTTPDGVLAFNIAKKIEI